MPLVAILIQQMPTIIAGLSSLFRRRHPNVSMPTDAQMIEALQAALSGSHNTGPLVALAAEQLPQIQALIIKLWSERRTPDEVATGPTEDQMMDAFEDSFKEACRAGLAKADAFLAKHQHPVPDPPK